VQVSEEVWRRRAAQRQRQIDIGKGRPEYGWYQQTIPESQRSSNHPATPDPSARISKRAFDRQLSNWRRQLHDFDKHIGATSSFSADQASVPPDEQIMAEQPQNQSEPTGLTSAGHSSASESTHADLEAQEVLTPPMDMQTSCHTDKSSDGSSVSRSLPLADLLPPPEATSSCSASVPTTAGKSWPGSILLQNGQPLPGAASVLNALAMNHMQSPPGACLWNASGVRHPPTEAQWFPQVPALPAMPALPALSAGLNASPAPAVGACLTSKTAAATLDCRRQGENASHNPGSATDRPIPIREEELHDARQVPMHTATSPANLSQAPRPPTLASRAALEPVFHEAESREPSVCTPTSPQSDSPEGMRKQLDCAPSTPKKRCSHSPKSPDSSNWMLHVTTPSPQQPRYRPLPSQFSSASTAPAQFMRMQPMTPIQRPSYYTPTTAGTLGPPSCASHCFTSSSAGSPPVMPFHMPSGSMFPICGRPPTPHIAPALQLPYNSPAPRQCGIHGLTPVPRPTSSEAVWLASRSPPSWSANQMAEWRA